jgi:hypothetical protein
MLIQFPSSWFCHFDDDQYVNVAALEAKLRQFDPREEWYLGKPSIGKPLDILDRDSREVQVATSSSTLAPDSRIISSESRHVL